MRVERQITTAHTAEVDLSARWRHYPHVTNALHSSLDSEYYTPPEIIEPCREVMGGITFDPCSCALANTLVKADSYYFYGDGSVECVQAWQPGGRQANGLLSPWTAHTWEPSRLWLNPPYTRKGGGPVEKWLAKLEVEMAAGNVEQAILLLNGTHDRKWFKRLWSYPICWLDDRINFLQAVETIRVKKPNAVEELPGLARNGSPTHGNVLVYFAEPSRFPQFVENARIRALGTITVPAESGVKVV